MNFPQRTSILPRIAAILGVSLVVLAGSAGVLLASREVACAQVNCTELENLGQWPSPSQLDSLTFAVGNVDFDSELELVYIRENQLYIGNVDGTTVTVPIAAPAFPATNQRIAALADFNRNGIHTIVYTQDSPSNLPASGVYRFDVGSGIRQVASGIHGNTHVVLDDVDGAEVSISSSSRAKPSPSPTRIWEPFMCTITMASSSTDSRCSGCCPFFSIRGTIYKRAR